MDIEIGCAQWMQQEDADADGVDGYDGWINQRMLDVEEGCTQRLKEDVEVDVMEEDIDGYIDVKACVPMMKREDVDRGGSRWMLRRMFWMERSDGRRWWKDVVKGCGWRRCWRDVVKGCGGRVDMVDRRTVERRCCFFLAGMELKKRIVLYCIELN